MTMALRYSILTKQSVPLGFQNDIATSWCYVFLLNEPENTEHLNYIDALNFQSNIKTN